jgi:GcrA cell cycle regulator
MNVQAPSRFNNSHKVDLKKAAELWADNVSAAKIAAMFGVTRSSVIGLTYRNRELFPLKPKKVSLRRIMKEARAKLPKAPKPPKPLSPQKVAKIEANEYDTSRADFAKPLHLLGACECHWPLNEGDPFMFCAAVTDDGQSFCVQHKMRAYRPRIKREKVRA